MRDCIYGKLVMKCQWQKKQEMWKS